MMKDEDIKAALAALDLVVPDPWRFFMLLDLNGNGEVTEDEFVEGCLRLRGPARTFDVASLTEVPWGCLRLEMLEENLRMKAKLVNLEEQQDIQKESLKGSAQESNLTHLRNLLAEISPGGRVFWFVCSSPKIKWPGKEKDSSPGCSLRLEIEAASP